MKAAIARKIGSSHIYGDNGNHVPVTLIEVVPNYVIKQGTVNSEQKVLLGAKTRKRANKPITDMLKKAGIDKVLTKFKEFKGAGELEEFAVGDTVKVTSVTKGKGFAGTIKRHGFKRGPASHGGMNVREPGSIGAQQPQRVIKGKRMAGHMGAQQRTIKNLKVVEVDKQHNIVAVSGSVPGPNKSWVYVWQ